MTFDLVMCDIGKRHNVKVPIVHLSVPMIQVWL